MREKSLLTLMFGMYQLSNCSGCCDCLFGAQNNGPAGAQSQTVPRVTELPPSEPSPSRSPRWHIPKTSSPTPQFFDSAKDLSELYFFDIPMLVVPDDCNLIEKLAPDLPENQRGYFVTQSKVDNVSKVRDKVVIHAAEPDEGCANIRAEIDQYKLTEMPSNCGIRDYVVLRRDSFKEQIAEFVRKPITTSLMPSIFDTPSKSLILARFKVDGSDDAYFLIQRGQNRTWFLIDPSAIDWDKVEIISMPFQFPSVLDSSDDKDSILRIAGAREQADPADARTPELLRSSGAGEAGNLRSLMGNVELPQATRRDAVPERMTQVNEGISESEYLRKNDAFRDCKFCFIACPYVLAEISVGGELFKFNNASAESIRDFYETIKKYDSKPLLIGQNPSTGKKFFAILNRNNDGKMEMIKDLGIRVPEYDHTPRFDFSCMLNIRIDPNAFKITQNRQKAQEYYAKLYKELILPKSALDRSLMVGFDSNDRFTSDGITRKSPIAREIVNIGLQANNFHESGLDIKKLFLITNTGPNAEVEAYNVILNNETSSDTCYWLVCGHSKMSLDQAVTLLKPIGMQYVKDGLYYVFPTQAEAEEFFKKTRDYPQDVKKMTQELLQKATETEPARGSIGFRWAKDKDNLKEGEKPLFLYLFFGHGVGQNLGPDGNYFTQE